MDKERQPGCIEFLKTCKERGVRIGVVTRNARRSVDHFCRDTASVSTES